MTPRSPASTATPTDDGTLPPALSVRRSVPANGSRSATGPATCCSPRVRRCSSRAKVVYTWPSFSVSPHLAAASGARAVGTRRRRPEHGLDPGIGDHRRRRLVIVCTEQPDLDSAAARDHGVRPRRPAPRRGDPRRGLSVFSLLQNQDDSLNLWPTLQPRVPAHVQQGLRPLRLHIGYGLCGSKAFRTTVDQVPSRSPHVAAQAAAIKALSTERSRARVERDLARADEARSLRGLGLDPRIRWQLRLVRPAGGPATARSSRRFSERRVPRPLGSRSARDALRVTVGPERRPKLLAALGALLAGAGSDERAVPRRARRGAGRPERRAARRRPRLEVPGAEEARGVRDELVGQIDDYLLPRLRRWTRRC